MTRRSFLQAALAVAGSGLLPARAGAGESMRIAYFEDFPPFSWRNRNRQMEGVFIDVLNEVLGRRMNIPVLHEGFPWARAQQMVRDGLADAFCTVPTEERRSYTQPASEPVVTATFTMFAPRHGGALERLKEVNRLADLKPFLIGHYLGSGWAHQKLQGMRVDWAPDLDLALQKLARGRDDVLIDVAEVLRSRVRQLGLDTELAELPQVLDSQPFSLCIRKGSPYEAVLPDFDRIMRQAREDGIVKEVYRKFDILPAAKPT